MAKMKLTTHRVSIRHPVHNVPMAAAAVAKGLIDQRAERFATAGRSDNLNWPALRWREGLPIYNTGKLRDLVEVNVDIGRQQFTVSMSPAPSMELIANVHQFGVKKDIVPRNAKALFIPLSNKGARSTRILEDGKPIRIGQKGNVRGRKKRRSDLVGGKDFLIRGAVKATAEKGGYAIQPRPHMVVTDDNKQDLAERIVESQL